MHNDPEKKKNTAFFAFDLKHSHLTVNKNKSPGGFEKRLLRKGFRSTFCHCVNGSTCGDLVPPSLYSRQRAWDGLLWPLGYLTDGAVPSPAPNLHSVHRNDSLKSAQAKLAERTPSTTRANAASAGGSVCFPLSFLLYYVLVLLLNSLSLSFNVEFQCFPLCLIECYCHSWAEGNAFWIRGCVSFLFLYLNATARLHIYAVRLFYFCHLMKWFFATVAFDFLRV